jgi:hypothetical protein
VALLGQAFRVQYIDFPLTFPLTGASEAEIEKAMERAGASAADDHKARLLARKKAWLGEHPGREFLVQRNEDVCTRCRAYLVRSRLYLVSLEGLKEQVCSPEADAFLDSFRLTGRVPEPPATPKPPPWQPFRSAEGRFTVLLPGTPRQVDKPLPEITPAVVFHQFSLTAAGLCWFVAYYDVPRVPPDPQLVLATTAKHMATHLSGKIISEEVLPGRHPGREVLIRGEEGVHARARYFLVGRRLYQLIAAGRADQVKSATADRFLDSFQPAK